MLLGRGGDEQPAGETLHHDGVVNHQAGQGAEDLAEALDPEPGLGGHDEIVEDPGLVVAPGHPHTEGQVPGGSLAPGVPNNEGADRSLRQEPDCQVPGQVGLIPAGPLRQRLHEGQVDDSPRLLAAGGGAAGAGADAAGGVLDVGSVLRLAGVAGQAVVVVIVRHSCLRVSKIVHNFLQRSLLLFLVGLVVVVAVKFVLHLVVEQQIIFHLKEEKN